MTAGARAPRTAASPASCALSVRWFSAICDFAGKVESGRASRDRREQRQAEFANTAADLQTPGREDADKTSLSKIVFNGLLTIFWHVCGQI
jgi:hypothetical protein